MSGLACTSCKTTPLPDLPTPFSVVNIYEMVYNERLVGQLSEFDASSTSFFMQQKRGLHVLLWLISHSALLKP